jgi:hypothetical protein
MLYQFASKDEYVSKATADALVAATPGKPDAVTYETGHELNDEATRDRVAWLKNQLQFKLGCTGAGARERAPRSPSVMPLLFSYGTLQETRVQLSTFGRLLAGEPDALPGFEPSLVKIEDAHVATATGRTHHANVTFNGRRDSRVTGTVFEITDAELSVADEYERQASYTRVPVTLASGKQAWVYVDARSAAGGA